jgi:hypothetical protein
MQLSMMQCVQETHKVRLGQKKETYLIVRPEIKILQKSFLTHFQGKCILQLYGLSNYDVTSSLNHQVRKEKK